MAPGTGVVDLKGLDDVQACSLRPQRAPLASTACLLPGSWVMELHASSGPDLGVVLSGLRTRKALGGYTAVLAPLWKTRQVLQGQRKVCLVPDLHPIRPGTSFPPRRISTATCNMIFSVTGKQMRWAWGWQSQKHLQYLTF